MRVVTVAGGPALTAYLSLLLRDGPRAAPVVEMSLEEALQRWPLEPPKPPRIWTARHQSMRERARRLRQLARAKG